MSKYKFNKDQLKFVEDKLGIYGKLRIAVTYLFVSLLLAVLYYVIFSSFIYTGEEIIRQVSRDKSCIWDLDTFIYIAKDVYPDEEVVANIPLSDREETGEI